MLLKIRHKVDAGVASAYDSVCVLGVNEISHVCGHPLSLHSFQTQVHDLVPALSYHGCNQGDTWFLQSFKWEGN